MGVLSLDTEVYQRMLDHEQAKEEFLEVLTQDYRNSLLSSGSDFAEVCETMMNDEPYWRIDDMLRKLYLSFTTPGRNEDRSDIVCQLVAYIRTNLEKTANRKAQEEYVRRQNDFE